LPARGWQHIQCAHLAREGYKKSSKKWMKGLLLRLNNLNHGQWTHRCNVKANVTKSQEKLHIQLLHDLINAEFVSGEDDLLPGDRNLLHRNILQLLQKPISYKKGWIVRMHAARQHAKRIETKKNDLQLKSKETSRLYQWLAIHRSDNWSGKNKRKYKEIESETDATIDTQRGTGDRAEEENRAQSRTEEESSAQNGNQPKLMQMNPNKYQRSEKIQLYRAHQQGG
jgi:hypothetical protein